ncbi:hypothetical protein NP493_2236g00006 [Ridgeia piscesae]|uniref:Uncharacterized protein n=1 Tax=Ridgeia piscesae TaxID=27915 RepID=A0AAD9JJQ9_RIDPI|nr:hypothetical protein NP493_2236g00006 [Ridgeia piscesae]
MPRATPATSLQSEDIQNCCTSEKYSRRCPVCDCWYYGLGSVRWYWWGCKAYGSKGFEVWGWVRRNWQYGLLESHSGAYGKCRYGKIWLWSKR